ncbi:hypothetical protein ACIBF7_32900 [Nonomuraea sp. NPDC050478]|uniref:hypothetical protein n=1 Tax=Nonomuraea sp. NPDC050478 TaxID=3364365 RepID=UPI00378BCF8D
MTEHVVPAGEDGVPDRHDDLMNMCAWRHGPGRVRTSPEEFLAVSGLPDHERRLLRERYSLRGGATPTTASAEVGRRRAV